MDEHAVAEEKAKNPATHFVEPRDVVADPSLTSTQKSEALDSLEQDARQLAEATSEGMAGGERNKLHDVLNAKDTLAMLPMADAYASVLEDMRLREAEKPGADTLLLLKQAIPAIKGLIDIFASSSRAAGDVVSTALPAVRSSR